MAERRMLSKKIVDADAFMDMPLSTQALYFHFSVRADDEGFVGNPKKIMRMIGANDDDYKVLITKRFVLQFPSGVCVIKHWLIHNYIQSDRKHETQYVEERKSLTIKENKAYTEVDTNRIQPVSKMDSEVRLGKVRLGEKPPEEDGVAIAAVINCFKDVNPSYERLFASPPQRAAAARLLKQHGAEKLNAMLTFLPTSNASRFAPTITTPVQFEQRLGDLIAWSKKQKDITHKGKGLA